MAKEEKNGKLRFKTYLAGPIGDVSIKDAGDWRKWMTKKLAKMGIESLDPLKKEGQAAIKGKISELSKIGNLDSIRILVNRELIDPDLILVEKCDFVTLWMPTEASAEICGSYGEITYAYKLGKPVYIVTERRIRPLNIPYWAVGCSTKIFRNWHDYLKYLKDTWTEKTEEAPKETQQPAKPQP
jgi:nucleoside 2-deoxyribosyltransferase